MGVSIRRDSTVFSIFFLNFIVVFLRSRSSDDLLDIDFSQTSFPAQNSESTTSGSQRNSLQLSQNGVASKADTEQPKSQSSVDLRSSAATLPSSSSLGI